ncbi:MAG TPA: hypothetical protein VEY95_13035 [Azospirillaceae bacterium]|nr:hypothetical protein [Azospirillaceae bacterium]
MNEKTLLILVVVLAILGTIIDFAAMLLSRLVDGVLMAAVVYAVWRLKSGYDRQITDLKAEVRLLQRNGPRGPGA